MNTKTKVEIASLIYVIRGKADDLEHYLGHSWDEVEALTLADTIATTVQTLIFQLSCRPLFRAAIQDMEETRGR